MFESRGLHPGLLRGVTATASLRPMLACPFSVPTGLALGGQTCCRPWPVLKAAGSSLKYLCGFSRYLNVPMSLTGKQARVNHSSSPAKRWRAVSRLTATKSTVCCPHHSLTLTLALALTLTLTLPTLRSAGSLLLPGPVSFSFPPLLFLSLSALFFVVAIPSSRIAKAEARTFKLSNGRGRSKQLTRYRHLFTPAIGDGPPLPFPAAQPFRGPRSGCSRPRTGRFFCLCALLSGGFLATARAAASTPSPQGLYQCMTRMVVLTGAFFSRISGARRPPVPAWNTSTLT